MKIVKNYWAEVVNAPVLFVTGMWSIVKLGAGASGAAFVVPFMLFFISGVISLITMLWRLMSKDMSIDQDKN